MPAAQTWPRLTRPPLLEPMFEPKPATVVAPFADLLRRTLEPKLRFSQGFAPKLTEERDKAQIHILNLEVNA